MILSVEKKKKGVLSLIKKKTGQQQEKEIVLIVTNVYMYVRWELTFVTERN
ncbi:hypothetical protein D3C72_2496450 [compost metagenome]